MHPYQGFQVSSVHSIPLFFPTALLLWQLNLSDRCRVKFPDPTSGNGYLAMCTDYPGIWMSYRACTLSALLI